MRYIILLALLTLLLISACNKDEELLLDEVVFVDTFVDVCGSSLLVMSVEDCRLGCVLYDDSLVGALEFELAIEGCDVDWEKVK